MVKSHVMHEKPIMGSHYVPYRESGMRGFEPLPVVGFLYEYKNKMKDELEDKKAEREYKEMMKTVIILDNPPSLDPDSDELEPPFGLDIERVESGHPLEDHEDDVPEQPNEE